MRWIPVCDLSPTSTSLLQATDSKGPLEGARFIKYFPLQLFSVFDGNDVDPSTWVSGGPRGPHRGPSSVSHWPHFTQRREINNKEQLPHGNSAGLEVTGTDGSQAALVHTCAHVLCPQGPRRHTQQQVFQPGGKNVTGCTPLLRKRRSYARAPRNNGNFEASKLQTKKPKTRRNVISHSILPVTGERWGESLVPI